MCMLCHKVFRAIFGEKQIRPVFIWAMRLLVTLLNVMPFYVMNSEMNEWVDDHMDRKLIKIIFNSLVFMTLISYYKASFTRPRIIPQLAPSEAEMNNVCVTCKNWKPLRTHHCSVCQVCVPKMDHHCPWLGNCVGYHNFKAFFLFCLYQALTGLWYCKRMIMFAFFSPDQTPQLSLVGQICYYFTNVFGLLISFSLIPLTIRIMIQLYNNITTLEMLKNKQMRYPCWSKTKSGGEVLPPNEYDMFWLNNLKQVLGPSLWMWPFPFAPEIKGEGLFYPRMPTVQTSQLQQSERSYVKEDFEFQADDYIRKAVAKYKGQSFILRSAEFPEGQFITV